MNEGGMQRRDLRLAPLLNSSWIDFWKRDREGRSCRETAVNGGTGRFIGNLATLVYKTARGGGTSWSVQFAARKVNQNAC